MDSGNGQPRMRPVHSLVLHPEAGKVPAMRPAEYAAFVADVKERGVLLALEVEPGTREGSRGGGRTSEI